MKPLHTLFFIPFFLFACNRASEESTSDDSDAIETEESSDSSEIEDLSDLEVSLSGNWESLLLDIDIQTDDSIQNVKYLASEFPEKLGIKNNYTSYREDGTFLSRYVSPEGDIMMEEGGTWHVNMDSLYVFYENAEITYSYDYKVSGDTIYWQTIYDWDQDGEMDDLTRGVAIRSTAPFFE